MGLVVKLCFLAALALVKAADLPTVTITEGIVKGQERLDKDGNTFYSFNSIPYAKPPIGDLRFMDPVAPEKWTGTLEAFTDLMPCYQADFYGIRTGDEDCLYLNVFTPTLSTSAPKPVMVFLHGGGVGAGTGGEELYAPEFLITEDVVIVVPNFRVGIFGFLSSGTIGNAGLKDQVMALKWVQRNIQQFGGDPTKVTVFGESTGAHATELLVLSPLAKDLFHNAVIQSYTPYSIPTKLENIQLVADNLGLNSVNPDEILEELQSLNGTDLLDAAPALTLLRAVYIEEKSDTAFLTDEPSSIISSGNYNEVTLMFGYNDAEGIAKDQLNLAIYGQHVLVTDFKEMIPSQYLVDMNGTEAEELASRIKEFYYGDSEPSTDDMVTYVRMITDASYAIPTLRAVRTFVASSSKPVYLYKFSADTGLNVYKWRIPITGLYKGASHADELGYLFNTTMTPTIVKDSVEDKALSRILKVWGNFARTGNPSSGDAWSAVTKSNINYIDIGTADNEARVDPDSEAYQFWSENVYPELGLGASASVRAMLILVVFSAIVALL